MGWDLAYYENLNQNLDFNPPTPCGVGLGFHHGMGGRANFNPPTPCGVGQVAYVVAVACGLFQSTHPVWGGTVEPLRRQGSCLFQSTHPVWGGTRLDCPRWGRGTISIHPPRVGWDGFGPMKPTNADNFNPPTPCGVGLTSGAGIGEVPIFQSTHPVWGGTSCHVSCSPSIPNFNPPTPCGVGRYKNFRFHRRF